MKQAKELRHRCEALRRRRGRVRHPRVHRRREGRCGIRGQRDALDTAAQVPRRKGVRRKVQGQTWRLSLLPRRLGLCRHLRDCRALDRAKDWTQDGIRDALKATNLKTAFGPVKFEDKEGYQNQNFAETLPSRCRRANSRPSGPKSQASKPYVFPVPTLEGEKVNRVRSADVRNTVIVFPLEFNSALRTRHSALRYP